MDADDESILKSPAFFRQVKAECGTLCWPEDIDIAPESVWEDVSKDYARHSVVDESPSEPLFVAEDESEYGLAAPVQGTPKPAPT